MRKLVYFLAFIFISSAVGFAQTGFRLKTRSAAELYAEQRKTVGTWCRQDFEGSRLSDAAWDRFRALTTFKKNPDYTSVVVVSRFQVEPRENISWDMDVTYTIVGRYEHGAGWIAQSGTQTVTFQTKDIDGDILITNIDTNSPHVSKKAAIDWMKRELQTTTSDVEKIHLQDALKILDVPSVAGDASAR